MTSGPEADLARSRVPSITSRGHRATLLTDDGVRIEAAYEPRNPGIPAGQDGGTGGPSEDVAIVLAHGFNGALGRPALRRAAAAFRGREAVITFGFSSRGHMGHPR